MARKRFVLDKKTGDLVEVKADKETPQSQRLFGGFGKRKTKEIRALMESKCVTIVDEKSGELVNVARRRVKNRAKWPIISEAMAVDPWNIMAEKKALAAKGVHTEYTSTGEPILTSAAHRRAHCAALGYYDRNAGYSDKAPDNR